ncbi:GATA transcription factor 21-like [Benincasa hispida]|uniref:GATA transcription factor 21-like n=1 Tax=Benincasa hispida TaxID=102211 RepID=UPI0018FF6AFF|nr:GATA transcription factor 21-like [Benincasa hispida]
MNPLYPSSSFVEKQKEEQEEEDPNLKLYIFSSTSQVVAAAASSSSSSQLAFTSCFSTSNATQHDYQTMNLHLHHHLLQQSHHQLHRHHKGEKSIIGGSREENEVIFSSNMREASERSRLLEKKVEDDDHQMMKKEDHNGSAKYWMSSKMRLMQKMMINTNNKKVINGGANSDHQRATRNYNNNNNEGDGGKWETMTGKSSSSSCNRNIGVQNNGVRVCSDCNTTTTPLWRSGPQGPKSLCNACGIRQRKARRAMAEAANGGGGSVVETTPSGKKEMHKEKKSRLNCDGDSNGGNVGDVKINKCNNNDDHKSYNNLKSQSEKGMMNNEVSFDGTHNFTLRLSKTSGPSAFGKVFPRDEEEAAILLMELSCGLLHSC